MFRKKFRGLIRIFMIGLLVSTTVIVYAASSSSSIRNYGPVLGYSYTNKATITTSDSDALASTKLSSTSGAPPAGYMGCCTRLYNTSNVLISQSKWIFNDHPNTTTIIHSGSRTYTPGTYYSKGLTAAYNHYDTYKSPNLSF